MAPFIIGTGYHHSSCGDWEQTSRWRVNVHKYAPNYKSIVVVSTGAPFPISHRGVNVMYGGNLGHVGQLISGERSNQLCGWSASVVLLAMAAYNCNADMVYLEEDALAFGPWLERAYADMVDGMMVFGHKHESAPWQSCSQSLFIIRHAFLLEFVRQYLSLPPDAVMVPELKFVEIEGITGKCRRLSFGVDRVRPIPYEAECFYAQQLTTDELRELESRKLI